MKKIKAEPDGGKKSEDFRLELTKVTHVIFLVF